MIFHLNSDRREQWFGPLPLLLAVWLICAPILTFAQTPSRNKPKQNPDQAAGLEEADANMEQRRIVAFKSFAADDFFRAIEMAKSLKGEAPRAVATLAVARSVFEPATPGSRASE